MNNEKICQSCKKEISGDFKICPYCGVKVNEDDEYIYEKYQYEKKCKSCGKSIKNEYQVCPYCGYNEETSSAKNGLIFMGLLVFFGFFEAHRFYAGRLITAATLYILNLIFTAILTVNFIILILYSIYGNTWGDTAILWIFISLFYFVFWFIWWVIDLILMISGKFKDSKGRYIKIKD